MISLHSSKPAEFAVYKPVLILFGLIDGLQNLLKVCLTLRPALMYVCMYALVGMIIRSPMLLKGFGKNAILFLC